jgi:tetratricopeptide (TPR) repeat protein
MSKKRQSTIQESEVLWTRDLEDRLADTPDDIGLQLDLAYALVECHAYGEPGREPGDETCINRLRQLLNALPRDATPYHRAYLANIDGQEKECVKELVRFASALSQEEAVPLSGDELLDIFIGPFDLPGKAWQRVANALSKGWPEVAASLTLHGFAKMSDDETMEEAIDYLVRALDKDPHFWLAAYWCASIYAEQRNWRAAQNYYRKALESETVQEAPDIHFDLAWCAGKLRDYQEEERHYRACLELEPDYQYVRNNLGWSLYKQHKYEEALEVFDEAIKRGSDGRYPLRNKAKTLVRLGRIPEAIEVLKQDIYKGKIAQSTQRRIVELEELLAKQAQESGGTEESTRQPREETQEAVAVEDEYEEEGDTSPQPEGRKLPPGARPVRSERWLERMFEDQILNEQQAFGRRLQMYDHGDDYGRQYAIPGVGQIDLLAEDLETGDLVVIELKKGRSDDQVVGQISRYMTWVRENLAERNQKTLGIICVRRVSTNLRLSAKNIPGLEVFEYGLTGERYTLGTSSGKVPEGHPSSCPRKIRFRGIMLIS